MNIPVHIDENSAEPLYAQIEKQLRSLIVTGQIAAGTLLPSIREFAGTLRCSVITVRRVYQDLENEGLLRTRQGTGTFVALVEENMRSAHRLKAVTEALDTAIATGIAVQMTEQELLELFAEMVKKRYEVKAKE
ncbi:GntR family transcriptional regulator [Paenibacillus kribbensis]|uniref:GntR family transcriptional regulator n=1 Tax=Paenibacillus kribbensis TaxID=172713 RepID=A0A222WSN6_9BACL|nr:MULTISPECIES: GntR family transcriptional regulator [Paenibacillus]ASR49206.1 GntR family transcriptional regulator [Paenibacillus kribbensis]EHS59599.1 transcriptional regulator, gntr family [Paenibacillus sp. Aloe-11]MEC0236928.1 GntR family transcriptional regulator [Paenibacillus kribbensis]